MSKTLSLLGVATTFLLMHQLHAQPEWSTPVMILPGPANEEHPTFAEGFGWLFGSAHEWLAFSRNGKEICFIRSTNASWDTVVTVISVDTAGNTNPSLARRGGFAPASDEGMLVWQGRARGNYDLYYATYNDSQWSLPRAITIHPADDINPHLVFADSTYSLVWQRGGAIYYSEFSRSSWSPERLLSAPDDSTNSFPRVQRQSWSAYYPRVVWERKKGRDSSYALWYAHRISGVWSPAESLFQAGNERHPRFLKYAPVDAIVWESYLPDAVTCQAAYLSLAGTRLRLETPGPLAMGFLRQANPSVNGYMVITAPYLQPTNVFYALAAWEARDYPIDSIGVAVTPFGWVANQKLSAGGNTSSRNPDVSQGLIMPGGFVRIWVVWEAKRSDRSKLYGSYVDIPIGDVEEERHSAPGFALHQNYPNPFNPATTIAFRIQRAGLVTLKVYDMLGREVKTLMNEVKEEGEHSVMFDATGFASGVYFYRLDADGQRLVRRMVFVR